MEPSGTGTLMRRMAPEGINGQSRVSFGASLGPFCSGFTKRHIGE